MNCRHCKSAVNLEFYDLGTSPIANSFMDPTDVELPDLWYPLRVLVCEHCWLAQTQDFSPAENLFTPDYVYYSSYSSSWLEHSERYARMIVEKLNLGSGNFVIEVACNDGYLLQFFRNLGIPNLGIEPTLTAEAARNKGIDVVQDFFSEDLAKSLVGKTGNVDLMIGNNVLAHVPDINDFLRGFAIMLAPNGVATFEFPHLMKLVGGNQFDTIYHEHFSYFSLTALIGIFQANGLFIFDVEELETHGGSLRIYAAISGSPGLDMVSPRVESLLEEEAAAGIKTPDFYGNAQKRARKARNRLIEFLITAEQQGQRVVGYGAAAKGNTLLNYAGIKSDLLAYVVDKNPSKQGKLLPGSRIPVKSPENLTADKPDYVLILPWNLRREIADELSFIAEWEGRFVTAIPNLNVSP